MPNPLSESVVEDQVKAYYIIKMNGSGPHPYTDSFKRKKLKIEKLYVGKRRITTREAKDKSKVVHPSIRIVLPPPPHSIAFTRSRAAHDTNDKQLSFIHHHNHYALPWSATALLTEIYTIISVTLSVSQAARSHNGVHFVLFLRIVLYIQH